MSRYINEIIQDIKTNPETWKRYGDSGLQKGDVIIHQCGNGHKFFMGRITSVVEVTINGKDTWSNASWRDKYRIEETLLWLIRNA